MTTSACSYPAPKPESINILRLSHNATGQVTHDRGKEVVHATLCMAHCGAGHSAVVKSRPTARLRAQRLGLLSMAGDFKTLDLKTFARGSLLDLICLKKLVHDSQGGQNGRDSSSPLRGT
jgi:hypothetical protein